VPRISAVEIARHAQAAGFRGADLQTSVAVALAESGGNTDAHAVTSREDSRGLWQINVRAHSEFASANLYDPATNARAARAVLRKQGWRAWSAFTNGSFLLRMPQAGAAVQSLPLALETGQIGEGVAREATPIDEIEGALAGAKVGAETFTRINAWITTPANWARVAYVIIGGALVIGGVLILAVPMITGAAKSPAGKLATKAVLK
jgi:hypothetical protein